MKTCSAFILASLSLVLGASTAAAASFDEAFPTEPPVAVATPDAAPTKPAPKEHPSATGTSFDFTLFVPFGVGDIVAGGPALTDWYGTGVGARVDVTVYPTRHLGFYGGLQGALTYVPSDDSTVDENGAPSKVDAIAVSWAAPVGVEALWNDRVSGPYLRVGLSLLSRVAMLKGDTVISARNDLGEMHFELGWRFFGEGWGKSTSMYVAMDTGTFTHVAVSGSGVSASGDVASADRSRHYIPMVGFSTRL